jgi:hypothetical protein
MAVWDPAQTGVLERIALVVCEPAQTAGVLERIRMSRRAEPQRYIRRVLREYGRYRPASSKRRIPSSRSASGLAWISC